MRTWKCRLVFYFALVLFFWAQWGTPATAEQAVRIGTSKFWANVPLYVGTKLGLFDKEGVKVQLIEVGNPNIIIEGIAAGDLEGDATEPIFFYPTVRVIDPPPGFDDVWRAYDEVVHGVATERLTVGSPL